MDECPLVRGRHDLPRNIAMLCSVARAATESDILSTVIRTAQTHPMFRTYFQPVPVKNREKRVREAVQSGVPTSGLYVEVIQPVSNVSCEIEEVRCSCEPLAFCDDAWLTVESEARHIFDLRKAPLVRLKLFTNPLGEKVLLIVASRTIASWWNLGELCLAFEEEASGREGARAISKHSAFRNLWASQRALRFWLGEWRSGTATPLTCRDLPIGLPRSGRPAERIRFVARQWARTESDAVARVAARNDVSRCAVILTACVRSLHELSQRPLMSLRVECDASDLSNGRFTYVDINEHVMSVQVPRNVSDDELLSRVSSQATVVAQHALVSADTVWQMAKKCMDMDGDRIVFQYLRAEHNGPQHMFDGPGWPIIDVAAGVTLRIGVLDAGDTIRIVLNYPDGHLRSGDAEEIIQHIVDAVGRMSGAPVETTQIQQTASIEALCNV